MLLELVCRKQLPPATGNEADVVGRKNQKKELKDTEKFSRAEGNSTVG